MMELETALKGNYLRRGSHDDAVRSIWNSNFERGTDAASFEVFNGRFDKLGISVRGEMS